MVMRTGQEFWRLARTSSMAATKSSSRPSSTPMAASRVTLKRFRSTTRYPGKQGVAKGQDDLVQQGQVGASGIRGDPDKALQVGRDRHHDQAGPSVRSGRAGGGARRPGSLRAFRSRGSSRKAACMRRLPGGGNPARRRPFSGESGPAGTCRVNHPSSQRSSEPVQSMGRITHRPSAARAGKISRVRHCVLPLVKLAHPGG